MTQTAPLLINPLIFAQQYAHFAGEVAVQKLPRLVRALADSTGVIHYDLQFQQDDERQIFVTINWQTQVTLVCQRCLQPFTMDLQYTSRLQAITDDMKPFADDVDPIVLNPQTHDFHLLELLTDEVLLQLPPVPRHPIEQCPTQLAETGEKKRPVQKQNPFANLRTLMDKNDE
jgi:DUF177 domain-containing protein